jgi:hypothetical protein
VRRQPAGSIIRQNHPPPAQSRRRPPSQHRALPHRLTRLRWDTHTRDYLTRRITEGKTRREAIRCLKRYIAREIYQIITSPPEAEPSAA